MRLPWASSAFLTNCSVIVEAPCWALWLRMSLTRARPIPWKSTPVVFVEARVLDRDHRVLDVGGDLTRAEQDFVLVAGQGADLLRRRRRRPRCSSRPCTGRSCRSPAGPGRPPPSSRRPSRRRRGSPSPSRTKRMRSFFSRGLLRFCFVAVELARAAHRHPVAGAFVERAAPSRGVAQHDQPAERRRQSSIAAMPDLTRNAVDVLPEGRLAEQLDGGPPAAGEAGDRPDHGRHPPRPHGRAREAARVPGRRPHRRPDHRRLHRPGRRSERPLGAAADALARGDRGQRRDLPGAGLQGARPRADRGPLQQRVAADGARGAARAAGADHGRAAARARRLPEADGGRTRRSRRWSCSTRCCRATTRSRSRPTSSWGGPTRSSTCSSAATSRPPTARRRSRS